jgi:thiol-disulfide isomerase/thioredoxin
VIAARARRLVIAATLGAALLTGALPARAQGPVPGHPPGALRAQFEQRYVGKKAPDFTLTDLKGKDYHLAALKGKVVLLNFWYSSCVPCRRETPDLSAIYRVHARDGLEILGINLDDLLMPTAGHAPLKVFLDEFKPPYPVLMADENVFDLYGGIPVQPISFLVDRGGNVAHLFWGAFPGAAFEKGIVALLEAPVAPPGKTAPTPSAPNSKPAPAAKPPAKSSA